MATQLSATFAPAATTTATPLPAPQQQLRHGRRCYRALSLRPPARRPAMTAPAARWSRCPGGARQDGHRHGRRRRRLRGRVLRIKSRVGPKKRGSAAARKRKGGAGTSSKSKAAVTLPPVPLREARSSVGVPVEFGFSAYSERLNGALAAVGLAALLLVELGSGKALVKYHQPATLFLQVYTVAAAGAVFVKYEKERISVWPGPPATKPPATGE